MKILGKFEGDADIRSKGESFGTVQFELEIYTDGRIKTGDGYLSGDWKIINDAFEKGSAMLVTPDGVEFDIIITQMNFQGPYPFKLSGVPRNTKDPI